MSDEESRTERASDQRLRRAWEEGQVPLGHDLPLVAGLAASALALSSVAGPLRASLTRLVAESARGLDEARFSALPDLLVPPVLGAVAVALAAGLAALVVTLAQTKGGFWPHLALPDLSRLAGGRMKRLFTRQVLVDVLASAVKVVAVGWAAWSALRADFLTLPSLLGATPEEQLARSFGILGRVALRVIGAGAVLAGLDLALSRYRFMAKMRMTKEEARREMKDEEGDPLLRSRRRRRHRDLARGRAAVEVPRADALLVNPTHVAVALRYRRDEGRAPRVTAKGKGALAEHMRDLARSNAIPIVQDVPLARLLYRKVKVGGEVPASTYKAVAAVLAFVYRLTGRAPGRGASA
jgi:flagellar biosynthesis protein FlhB